jgi:transcriptional regulator with XRE-family HTH domain
MATLNQQVGNLVRQHRKRAGLTQAKLASLADLSVEMINRIERGVTAPSFPTLERLSRILKAPIRDFFGVAQHSVNSKRDDPFQQIVDTISGLGTEDLKWLQGLITHVLRRKVRSS